MSSTAVHESTPSTSPAAAIAAWEDDPIGSVAENLPPANQPVPAAQPDFDPAGLKVGIAGAKPAPGTYSPGTAEFRYWVLADALARSAGYWSKRVPAGTTWQPDNGTRLIAVPDEGVDLNAYYDRNGLHFFHGAVRGTTLYSGESPDVVCHELGHAVLDALKPQLFDVASIEAAAFHESFGDCSAMLSNLMLPTFRQAVLDETGGRLSTASRLSRLAGSLGGGIRQLLPDAVAPDCLRSAVNSFYYQPPDTLPPRSPASGLASEPHSFSRVFTSGVLRVLNGVFAAQPRHDADALRKAAEDTGQLLVEGVRRAAVVPAFYAQVAAGMAAADAALFGGRYRKAVLAAFQAVGVLSVRSAAELSARLDGTTGARLAPEAAESVDDAATPLPLSGTAYGLPADLLVRGAAEPRRFGVASGLADTGEASAPAPEQAAASFVEDLLRRGRVDGSRADGAVPIVGRGLTTHEIVPTDRGLELRRTLFDCGFHIGETRPV
jgi:hypothetical protein